MEGGWTSLEVNSNDSEMSMDGRVGLTVPRTECSFHPLEKLEN